MGKKLAESSSVRVSDVADALARMAPPWLAKDWDNVGLLAGNPDAPCSRVLACVDMTEPVLREGIRARSQMIVAYHPAIFKPIRRLVASSGEMDSLVWAATSHGIAIYALHTALDTAQGGTNDVLARLCGLNETEAFGCVRSPAEQCKVVVFVPPDYVDRVAEAAFAGGAGVIGDYEKCSFRTPGKGTFFGTDQASPMIGQKGRLECVEEMRLEVICQRAALREVLTAIRASHPYEEPAIDTYSLVSEETMGIGRYGVLPKPTTVRNLALKLKKALSLHAVSIVGALNQRVQRVAVCAGAAGRLPIEADTPSSLAQLVVTGEIRHHDALTYLRLGKSAIALGHWASERPVLDHVAKRLRQELSGLDVRISRRDADPFANM